LTESIKLVFSNYPFVVLASAIFVGLLIPLLIISEYIFLEPFLIGYIAEDRELGFVLIIVVSALSGLVVSMNVFRIRLMRMSKKKMGGSVFGSVIGSVAGACGCGPIGFAMISTFGSIGGVAFSFLTTYEIPLRLAAIGFLVFVYYTTTKSLKIECQLIK